MTRDSYSELGPENAAEARRLRGAKGGMTSMSNRTPEERVALAKKAAAASAEARRRRREEAGLPEPKPRNRGTMPPAEQLEPYLRQIDAEGAELTYDERIREATLRLKRDIASAALIALRATGEQS
ncbi:hypothetical protein [Curtobacterium flaccumfaciens]|uniref:hypothetical protein n=1 Tax=Curtobacterium flaccumfaciens TaxID=2035 RepID=UPI00399440E3